jgi:hypothetical protein
MTDQLESRLRAALEERAALVPGASSARLTARDYHPRTRRVPRPAGLGALAVTARPGTLGPLPRAVRPRALGALAGAAAAAGGAVAVVSLGAGASNAFAGWTPTPTTSSPAQLAAANLDCQHHSPVAGLPLKLADTRGPFTFSVYADSNSSAICISGPSFTSVSGSASTAPTVVPAGQVLLSSSHMTNRAGEAFSFAEGHTGAGVSGVSLNLDGGGKVRATVANGWFVAWWPGSHEVKSADVATPTRVRTQTFAQVTGAPQVGMRSDSAGSGGPATSGSTRTQGPATPGSSGRRSGTSFGSTATRGPATPGSSGARGAQSFSSTASGGGGQVQSTSSTSK